MSRESEESGHTVSTQTLRADALPPAVLLVDDDELVLERLKALIAAAGFEVRTAGDGRAALAALKQSFTPIVIADRGMPEMDGLALCRAIRQQIWPGYVYTLLLTAKDAEEDILDGFEAGADDYLSKKASSAQLIARLRTAQRIVTLEHSLRLALEERRRIAMTDPLTGLNNRRYFMRHFLRELKSAERADGDLTLLLLDIDRFKSVNDRYGHAVGDEVLKEFARRIRAGLPRATDWCARLGGEEFVVALPHTRLEGARVIAEELRERVRAAPMRTAAGPLAVTVSIGASGLESLADRAAAGTDALLEQADRCLYASKENGRDRVTLPN